MREAAVLLGVFALLAGCRSEPQSPSAGASTAAAVTPVATTAAARDVPPSLARCPRAQPVDEPEMLQRKGPLAIPPALAGLMVSDRERLALTSQAGDPICIDASWMEEIAHAKVSGDRRFVSFNWNGYESFGHVVVDRTGKGTTIDTGETALTSPGGRRLAAVDLGEAGFGALNAFAVWQIEPVGLRQLASIDQGFPAGDWGLDGWRGENCINLSVVPVERQPESPGDLDKAPRDPWFATEAKGWKPAPGRCPP